MQFSTVLLAAMASGAAMANYNIKLYEHRSCLVKVGKTCSNVGARDCCSDGGKKYKSAKFAETGGSGATDQLKLYKESDCGGLAVEQHTGTSCLSHSEKEIQGAQVFVVINTRDEQSAAPSKRVEPDEAFMEDGRFKYTVKRDSPEGKAYDKLKRVEDQIEHLRTFGKREVIPEDVE
ncbi:hypothetical protein F4781DRAFT_131048 [Annulohypoxylon bovei var. microspora]|nr:hypothetical protein F4781DRAFT_131048 [Annulohypoxylon bovei var. microspora]